MKYWSLLFFSFLAALVLFVSLSFFYSQNTPTNVELEQPIQIVFKEVPENPMDFWVVVHEGIQEAAREFGIEVEISGPDHEKQIDRQIEVLSSVIEKGPPLIILAASDYVRLNGLLQRADEKGIPVITIDSGVSSELPVSFVATDNIAAGKKAGEELGRLLKDNPRKSIAIVSHMRETATGIEREEGVRQALQQHNIIGAWYCDVEKEKAYNITMDLLKNPDLGGIVALNEEVTLGVAEAVKEKNMQEKVLIVGFDNASREMAFLEEGILKATVVQRPYNMGYLSVKTAVQYLSGKQVSDFYDTGSILITRENMFKREYQEILFPFGEEP